MIFRRVVTRADEELAVEHWMYLPEDKPYHVEVVTIWFLRWRICRYTRTAPQRRHVLPTTHVYAPMPPVLPPRPRQ